MVGGDGGARRNARAARRCGLDVGGFVVLSCTTFAQADGSALCLQVSQGGVVGSSARVGTQWPVELAAVSAVSVQTLLDRWRFGHARQ